MATRPIIAFALAAVISGLSSNGLEARPLLFNRGAVNAASFIPPAAPGGAIARGSIFTIFGREIGPSMPVQVSEFPLEANFQGVTIEIIQANTTVNAIPIFVSVGQLNALMPSNAPLGRVSIRVTFGGDPSNPITAYVANNNVGIFTATGGGIGPGIVQNFITQLNQPINSARQTVEPGQVVTLWATGLGPISGPDGMPPPVGTLPVEIEIFVGGVAVTKVLYSGRAPLISGVDQFVFEIPAGVPDGCFVPLLIRVNGDSVSNTVTIAVQADGMPCADELNPFTPTLLSGGTIGALNLFRLSLEDDLGLASPSNVTADQAAAYLRQEVGGPFPFNPSLAAPPPGACTAYAVRGDVLAGASPPFIPPGDLDAGTLRWNGPQGERSLFRGGPDLLQRYVPEIVGGPQGLGAAADQPLYLTPGEYTVVSDGGSDVGPIDAATQVSEGFDWTNRNELEIVSRDRPLRLEWTGNAEAGVLVAGVSVDRPNNASGVFICFAPAGASSMDVPSRMLANLPANRDVIGQSRSLLLVGAAPVLSTFVSQGLDFGAVGAGSMQAVTVRWQ